MDEVKDNPLSRLVRFVGKYGVHAERQEDLDALEDLSKLKNGLERIAIGLHGRYESGLRENERWDELPGMGLTDWQLAQQLLGDLWPDDVEAKEGRP